MLIGGIGVMNVMLASVSQRIHEIGVRAAVGASPAALAVQFLSEAVLLTGLGGVLGVIVGELVAGWLQRNLGWLLNTSRELDIVVVVAAGALGIVFGYYPAARASRLDPIAALRHE